MRFRFKFLLKNGKSEFFTFTASTLSAARKAALYYSQSSAFDIDEVIDFEWKA